MALEHITTEQILAEGMASAPDVLNGTAAQNKARFDQLVAEVVAPAYNLCVDAVNALEEGEEAMEKMEAARQEAETQRASETRGIVQQAKSYVVGGTGLRDGEDTDNAKYYAERAASESDKAAEKAGEALAAKEAAQVAATNAETAEVSAKTYAENAKSSSDKAHTSEINTNYQLISAKGHAEKAREYWSGAMGAAADAATSAESASQSAQDALSAAEKYPNIGENGNWFKWNVQESVWEDTGVLAEGRDGVRGTGYLHVTTAPSEHTPLASDDFVYYYTFETDDVLSQSGVSEVLVGDLIMYSSYRYPVVDVGGGAVFCGARKYMGGKDGKDGDTPEKGVDYWTDADKQEMTADVLGETYYSSLSDALAQQNAVSASEARVKTAVGELGRTVVTLLEDLTSEAITVSASIDLVLNGKKITFSGATATLVFGADTDCTIDGRVDGSEIAFVNFNNTSTASALKISGNLAMLGGKYSLTGNASGLLVAINAANTCNILEMDGCVLDVSNTSTTTTKDTRCIQSLAANAVFKNCTMTLNRVGAKGFVYFGVSKASFNGCAINAKGTNYAYGIRNTLASGVKGELNFEGSTISAESEKYAYGIYNDADCTLRIVNSTITADAPGDNSNEEWSGGVQNYGVCHITNGKIFGTLSGVGNNGKLYVDGGTYTGYSHGGIYFSHDADGVAYVNDALIRCGNYEGIYEDVFAGDTVEPYGGFYVGGDAEACNMEVYIDGCTIDASMVSADREGNGAFCIRVAAGETGNTVNISNSVIVEGSPRIRVGDSHHLNVGIGTNITTDMIGEPSRASFTDKLYRKKHPSAALNGNDFAALAALWEA